VTALGADVPRILHCHSTFPAGGKDVRCTWLANAWGTRLHHGIVSAEPAAMGAAKLIDPGVPVDYPQDFPSLKGLPTPMRLAALARAMQPFDPVCTYNWGAMDVVMAHRRSRGPMACRRWCTTRMVSTLTRPKALSPRAIFIAARRWGGRRG
jgi:hypothetical protein